MQRMHVGIYKTACNGSIVSVESKQVKDDRKHVRIKFWLTFKRNR